MMLTAINDVWVFFDFKVAELTTVLVNFTCVTTLLAARWGIKRGALEYRKLAMLIMETCIE